MRERKERKRGKKKKKKKKGRKKVHTMPGKGIQYQKEKSQ
jgi:hypothetical protein